MHRWPLELIICTLSVLSVWFFCLWLFYFWGESLQPSTTCLKTLAALVCCFCILFSMEVYDFGHNATAGDGQRCKMCFAFDWRFRVCTCSWSSLSLWQLSVCAVAIPCDDWSHDQQHSSGGHAAQPKQRSSHLPGTRPTVLKVPHLNLTLGTFTPSHIETFSLGFPLWAFFL